MESFPKMEVAARDELCEVHFSLSLSLSLSLSPGLLYDQPAFVGSARRAATTSTKICIASVPVQRAPQSWILAAGE
jgi:hypothetical protein